MEGEVCATGIGVGVDAPGFIFAICQNIDAKTILPSVGKN